MKVSIVIAAYDNWPDLELAIQSALCQSHTPVEVIVVDNSSTDATAREVPRLFANRLRYERQPNRGDAGAYNAGLRLSQGEFVCFMDGDDVLSPYMIEKQLEAFAADPSADIVHGELRRFQSRAGAPGWTDRAAPDHKDMLAALLSPETQADSPSAMLFRRRALERVGPWDETVYLTDVDYLLRAAWLGLRFARCEGLLAFSRVHDKQMSADPEALHRGAVKVYSKALTTIDREPYRSLVRENLVRHRFISALLGHRLTRPLARQPAFRPLRRLAARAAGFRAPRF